VRLTVLCGLFKVQLIPIFSPFSIAMTTTSTLMAFAMMPLCLYIYTPSFIDEAISIPYTNICELQEHAQYK